MRKRLLAIILTFALVISGSTAVAVSSYETAGIKDTVEHYLTNYARNMYLYEENDTGFLSIDSMLGAAAGSLTYQVAKNSVSLNTFAHNIALFKDKIEYFKYIRSAQDFVVNDFAQSYTFEDVEVFSNTATVKLKELLTWQYLDYHLPSAYETSYEVTLIKDGNRWLVAQVVAPFDSFDQKYIIDGVPFDLESKKEQFDISLQAEEKAIQEYETQRNDVDVPSQAKAAKSYNASKAISYATNWALKRNSAFKDYDPYGGDCMNFASQCIYAGLGGSATTPDTNYMDKSGTSKSDKWYWDDWESWCNCAAFIKYINGSGAQLITERVDVLPYNSIPFWFPVDIAGCAALVESSSGSKYGHAIFLVDYASPLRKDIYYCAHNDNALNEKVSARYDGDDMLVIGPISLNN